MASGLLGPQIKAAIDAYIATLPEPKGEHIDRVLLMVAMGNAIEDWIAQVKWQESVLDYISDPPVAPNVGDRYLVLSPGTGAWAALSNHIVEWGSGVWTAVAPLEWMLVRVESLSTIYVYVGGTWEVYTTPYIETLLDDPDAPTARQTLELGSAAVEDVGAFDPAGAAAVAVGAHEGAPDPHPQYLTPVEGGAAYDALGAAATAQAYAIQRANHTGTQAIATVTGLQGALDAKAPLASPALTGTPTAPTAPADTNTTQLATTAFAKGEADAAQAAAVQRANHTGTQAIATVSGLQGALDGKLETAYLSGRVLNDPASADVAGVMVHYLADGAPLSPPGVDHALLTLSYSNLWSAQFAMDWREDKVYYRSQENGAWTAWKELSFVGHTQDASSILMSFSSRLLGRITAGSGAVEELTAADVKTILALAIADISGLQTALNLKAPLASPALTGVPTAPTAAAGTNTTQLATTAFAKGEADAAQAAAVQRANHTGTQAPATIQVSATDRLLGRVAAGAGPTEEILISDFVQGLLNDDSAATFRTSVGAAASGLATASGLTLATAKVLGRATAGTGAVEELTATTFGRALLALAGTLLTGSGFTVEAPFASFGYLLARRTSSVGAVQLVNVSDFVMDNLFPEVGASGFAGQLGITAAGLELVNDANVAAQRVTLGLPADNRARCRL